jgi:hypothetical protein
MGGRIALTSAGDASTVFTVILPAFEADAGAP